MLTNEQAEEILGYLQKYEYASFCHVVFALLWHTMMRRGAAHALDVSDYHVDERYTDRKQERRPKNDNEGERLVALNDTMCRLLDDWLAERRPDITDEYGRQPLLVLSRKRSFQAENLTARLHEFDYSDIDEDDECPAKSLLTKLTDEDEFDTNLDKLAERYL